MVSRKTKTSRNAAAAAKADYIETKKAVLETLCKSIYATAAAHKGRIPYGYMKEYVVAQKESYSWLTYHQLNCYYQRFKRKQVFVGEDVPQSVKRRPCEVIQTSGQNSVSDLSDSNTETARKAGQPSGTTIIEKRRKMDNIIDMKNDITKEYLDVKNKKGFVRKGVLQQIIQKHKNKRKLEDVDVPLITIRQRVVRKKTQVMHHHHGGHRSPLESIDNTIVSLVLMMARIRQCVTPSTGLALVNSLIDGQPIQDQLIQWKKKYCVSDQSGTIGKAYWRNFMNRNRHRLVSRRGQKYALD